MQYLSGRICQFPLCCSELPVAAGRPPGNTQREGYLNALAAPPMPKKPKPGEHASYASVKIDDEVLPLAIAAAALSSPPVTVQELVSDAVNKYASRLLDRDPVNRRPPPPKPHGRGRPPKSSPVNP